jgi:hypothetical protein
MGNFFNNGSKILKLIVRVGIYHILINIKKKNCWFENWIFTQKILYIYRSQKDYRIYTHVCYHFVLFIVGSSDSDLWHWLQVSSVQLFKQCWRCFYLGHHCYKVIKNNHVVLRCFKIQWILEIQSNLY